MHHVPCVCALIIIIICPVRIILRSHTQRVAAMCKFFARRFVGSSLFCSGWPGLVMRRGRRGRLISCYNLLTVLLFFPPTVLTVCQIYRSLLIKSALLKRGRQHTWGLSLKLKTLSATIACCCSMSASPLFLWLDCIFVHS